MPNYDLNIFCISPWYYQRDEIKKVIIKNGMTCIGRLAFHDCSNLTTITIPNSVMKIGDEAFYDCKSLTSITIPESVTEIEAYTFMDCM